MSKYQFGSIVDRDFRNTLQRVADEVEVHGKTIHDLVAEGQLTPGQYAELIQTVNGLISKGDVSVHDIDINKGKLGLKHLSEEVKSAMAGDTAILSEVADGAVTRSKVAKETISADKTNFFDLSTNLFNTETLKSNTTLETNGTEVYDDRRWLTDFIEIPESERMSITPSSYRIGLYDENFEFLQRTGITSSGDMDFTVYTRTKYIRVSGTTRINEVMLNNGTQLLPFEPFKEKVKKHTLPEIQELDGKLEAEQTDFFETRVNLFNKDDVAHKSTMENGEIVKDDIRWLGNEIPISFETTISVYPYGNYRIYHIREDGTSVRSGNTFTEDDGSFTTLSDEDFTKIRLSTTYNHTDPEDVQVNLGNELLPLSKYNQPFLKPEYIGHIDETEKALNQEEMIKEIQKWTNDPAPTIPRLNFETITTGWSDPAELSRDGKVLWGKQGLLLQQSIDEWETVQDVGHLGNSFDFASGTGILSIRELFDGELLVSTSRDEDTNQKAKVFKTVGYDRDNPTGDVQFKEVLESLVKQANIQNNWGMSVYENIVIVSEYGLRGVEGARHVYLSTDHGNTFKVIFDQMTTTAEIEGAPTWTESGHLHTVEYDPYWNRIWLVVGDNPNSATYYSDDLGESWTFVEGSTVVQYTGIKALPDAVIFGSDRNPNGVHHYIRGDKSEMPKIRTSLLLNDVDLITHVFQKAFKRDFKPSTPTYFAATAVSARDESSVITGTVNGKKSYVLWEADKTGIYSGNISVALGNTIQGNIIAVITDPTIDGRRIIKAKAPDWE